MENIEKTIKKYELIKKHEIIGVACSGGIDSMCLLHYLHINKERFGIDVVAINVDHSIRPNSAEDSAFVENFCKNNNIKCLKFKVNAVSYTAENKLTLEEGARDLRYKTFRGCIEKGFVTKVALAHHLQDQAETILLNIFRGTGLKGAGGMEFEHDNLIRPMLNTTKEEIKAYALANDIKFVEDETNNDNEYSRNFIRNEIMPRIRQNWKNVDKNIVNFGKICREDDMYLNSNIDFDGLIKEKSQVKIPLSNFAYPGTIVNRILRHAFEHLKLAKDIEKKHLEILKNLVKDGKNGNKISLPNGLKASLEYDFLTLAKTAKRPEMEEKDFKTGTTKFVDYGSIIVKKVSNYSFAENQHLIDATKLPEKAKWRTRQNGDVFAKFGSGEKKLKDYFIDMKIPSRLRNNIPVLAKGNEIYCVLGYEISNKVKIDDSTKKAYSIVFTKNKTK